MRTSLASTRSVAFVLLSVGLGLGGAAAFPGTGASAANGSPSIFNSSGLMPGDTLTGHLDVPSGNQPLTPYLQAINLRDGCVSGQTCTPDGPRLSQTVRLVVSAPNNGGTWQGTPADLLAKTTLPGGQLPANSGSRRYGIALIVPTALTNGSEDRTISLELQYGGMDSSDATVTAVLGETFTKPTSGSGTTTTSVLGEHASKSALPFTGSYAGIELLAGAALIGGGGILLLAGRQRRRRREA